MATDRFGDVLEVVFNQLTTTASTSGYFNSSESVEPKSAPGAGLTFACWLADIAPIPLRSGLPVTSARVAVMGRIYSSMTQEPQNRIDIDLGRAAGYMMTQLTGDFTVDGAWLDLMGAHGRGLAAAFGYLELGGKMFRVADITCPFIMDDVFDQED